ncbi:MAG: DNA-directed RNA polymerase subunit H [Candidatus Bathyarchaeia archaeon]
MRTTEEDETTRIDVLKHELVPKQVLLSKEETRQLLETYRIKHHHLPIIFVSDPAAKALKAKPGDIIKTIRKSATSGESPYYRYVLEEE